MGLCAQDISLLPQQTKFNFVAYGDVRFTNPADTRVSNPEVRRALVERIAEIKPAFVIMTGDLVLNGGNAADWKVWDAETGPLRSAGVPVFPVLGNHDLRDDPQAVNYFAHFPELKQRRWYSLRAGNALFFMLDSDADAPGGEQWKWLDQQLSRVPADVDFLFVVLHHPPYTHSSSHLLGGGHAARGPEQRLAAMLEQRQQALRPRIVVLAGHVHNYERYEHGGVTYIVTGGGGATPYAIERTPQDFYRDPGPTYHYVRFSVDGRKLHAEMIKYQAANGHVEWSVRDRFELEAAQLGKAAGAH